MDEEANTPEPLQEAQQVIYGTVVNTRAEAAYELHLAGRTLQEIADQLGYVDEASVAHAINSRMKIGAAYLTEQGRAGMLQVTTDRLNRLRAAGWAAAMTGDPRAIMAALAVEDRMIKLGQLDAQTADNTTNTVLVVSNEKSYVEKLKELADG